MRWNYWNCHLVIFLFVVSIRAQIRASSAYEVRAGLLRDALLGTEHRRDWRRWLLRLTREDVPRVSWGAEKEGTSALFTRVVSPTASFLSKRVEGMIDSGREAFLRDFFNGYLKTGRYRVYENARGEVIDLASSVKDAEGNLVSIDLGSLPMEETDSLGRLEILWHRWLRMTRNSPFSFIAPEKREDIFHTILWAPSAGDRFRTDLWTPILGRAQDYIAGLTNDETAWELRFVPQKRHGGFERMLSWFKGELAGDGGEPFESFGHQRAVFEEPFNRTKLLELFKITQAIAAIGEVRFADDSISGAAFKEVLPDFYLNYDARGAIGIEFSRWGRDRIGLELRTGVKRDDEMARFVRTVLTSRIDADDWSGLEDGRSWTLVPNEPHTFERFFGRAPSEEESRLWYRLFSLEELNRGFFIPLWNWEEAPFIGKAKRGLLASLKREFLDKILELAKMNVGRLAMSSKLLESMRTWIAKSNIEADLRNYIRPVRSAGDLGTLPRSSVAERVGLEIGYTGRFSTVGNFGDDDGKVAEGVARDLAEALGGGYSGDGGSGHGLEDARGRRWIVGWNPEATGEGGLLKVSTPKFSPSVYEIEKIYEVFRKYNIVPSPASGGGHIGVDLGVFETSPKALARFLSLFHIHRGVLSLMFQHPDRLKDADSVPLDARLAEEIGSFDGTKEELKRLLYDGRYFNTRLGRGVRDTQIDLVDYFYDVVPLYLRDKNFGMQKPKTGSMNLRFFNAPADTAESVLQIRLVRALLEKALNEDIPLGGAVTDTDHLSYVRDPEIAYDELEYLCRELGLDCRDYRPVLSASLSEAQHKSRFPGFVSFEKWMQRHPLRSGWGRPIIRVERIGCGKTLASTLQGL